MLQLDKGTEGSGVDLGDRFLSGEKPVGVTRKDILLFLETFKYIGDCITSAVCGIGLESFLQEM